MGLGSLVEARGAGVLASSLSAGLGFFRLHVPHAGPHLQFRGHRFRVRKRCKYRLYLVLRDFIHPSPKSFVCFQQLPVVVRTTCPGWLKVAGSSI